MRLINDPVNFKIALQKKKKRERYLAIRGYRILSHFNQSAVLREYTRREEMAVFRVTTSNKPKT